MSDTKNNSSDLQKCPICGEMSVFQNWHTSLRECLNPECKHALTETQYARLSLAVRKSAPSIETTPQQTRPATILSRFILILLGLIVGGGSVVAWFSFSGDGASKDQATLQLQYDQLVADYDAVIVQNQSLQQDSQSLELLYAKLLSDYDAVVLQNQSLQQDSQSLSQDYDTVAAQLKEAQQQLTQVRTELESVRQELQTYRDTGIRVYSGMQPPYDKASPYDFLPPSQITLENNPVSADPTWSDLKAFLRNDKTDERVYVESLFTCGDFAEMVHNNAEAAGIRSALVALHFDQAVPHALNAFNTTDIGLIYIDCTGQGTKSYMPTYTRNRFTGDELRDHSSDKVAFVEMGKEYGCLDLTDSTPLSYDGYEQMIAEWDAYDQRLSAYNQEVERFNREIQGRVYYIGTAEHTRISQWSADLDKEAAALDKEESQLVDAWESPGTVTSIEIYW